MKHIKLRTYLAAALFFLMDSLCCESGFGQDEYRTASEKVDRIFSKLNKTESPGAAVVVLKNGAIVHKRGYGMANIEKGSPNTPSTIMEVGSVAKQFTAFAIALLVDQKKLSLDEDIRTYVPEVPNFGDKITVRHLIHHTSGLRNWEVLFKLTGYNSTMDSKRALQMIKQQRELNFKPGEEYSYCNTGYLLLAEVVERVSNQTFREWTRINIFNPLGMKNTSFQDDPSKIDLKGTHGYFKDENGEFKQNGYGWAIPGPTSLFTTAEDLKKWIKNFDQTQLGGSGSIELMLQKGVLNDGTELNYAFGLKLSNYRGIKKVSHEGGWAGFRSVLAFYPEQNFGVAVLSNMNLGIFNPTPYANQIADIYLAHQLSEKGSLPIKSVKVNPNIYDAYTGKYISPLPYSSPKIVTILREKDRLSVQLEGKPKIELLPQSEAKFVVKDENIQLIFTPDKNGRFNHFIPLIDGGKKLLPARRLHSLDAAQLKEFTGDFISQEVATTWRISIHENQLLATHKMQKSVRLLFTGEDRFTGNQWWFQEIVFERDNKGRITGFRLTAEDGLVRKLAFTKQHE
jgi:CubicO group peptidase (beta-lactamase class C family)